MVTLTTGPCLRFESLVPSGATSSGRCANCGGSAPRASKISTCLKVLVRWSWPRMMWLMRKIGIVGAGGQVIRRHAVRPQQREVFDSSATLRLRAIDAIVEARSVRSCPARHAKAQRERLAGGGAAVAFFARQLAHARD